MRFRNIWVEPGTSIPSILVDFIELGHIGFDLVTNEVTLTWESSLEGGFTIQGGAGTDLSELTASNEVLPLEIATGVTFTLPASL